MPRLHAVQATGSAAIVDSLTRGGEIEAVEANTVADSISVDKPRDGDKARRAILESGGMGFKISDENILKAQKALSASTGIFAESAAATAYAGFLQASSRAIFQPDDQIVVLITGTGLKDIPAAQQGRIFWAFGARGYGLWGAGDSQQGRWSARGNRRRRFRLPD